MGFDVIDYIAKKKAGMTIVCQLIAKDYESQAKRNAKFKDRTGNARQGIKGEYEGGLNQHNIYLAHSVSYGEILEDGSKPHVITPKNGKFLYWKGAAHPVKKVNHSGTKGFKTLKSVLNDNKAKTIERIVRYWSD